MQFSYTHKRLTSLNLDLFFNLVVDHFTPLQLYYDFIKTVIFRFIS